MCARSRPGGPLLLPELLRFVYCPHAGIFDWIEIFALLDRRRTLLRIVEFGLVGRRRFQCLEERDRVADFRVVKYAMATPGRHHRLGIVNPRVINVVEQVFVLAACAPDFRKIGADITWQIGTPRRSHDMAGEARSPAITIGHQLGALFGITGNWAW